MLKALMLALTILVSAAWLQAQQYPLTGSGPSPQNDIQSDES